MKAKYKLLRSCSEMADRFESSCSSCLEGGDDDDDANRWYKRSWKKNQQQ